MKKVVITGHTSGIGKGLYDYFLSNNDNVIGYSRSNGFDLSNKDQLDRCIQEIISNDTEITILNAYAGRAQLTMLTLLNNIWCMNKNKTVVIIGSYGPDYCPNITPVYAIEKNALDRAAFEYTHNRLWRLINIRPGYTDTDMVKHVIINKMPVKDVVDSVIWAINAPDTCTIQSLTIIPRSQIK